MDVLVATDFFTTVVWTWCGLVTYYILFFIRFGTRGVHMVMIHLMIRRLARLRPYWIHSERRISGRLGSHVENPQQSIHQRATSLHPIIH
jgi:hypothetical protein